MMRNARREDAMKERRRTLKALVGLTGLWLVLSALPASAAPKDTGVGVIEEINLPSQELIVSGLSYRVALDAEVEIDGSYGAFTMLRRGMQIEFDFEKHSSTERVITRIQHIPDRFSIEEV